MVANWMKKGFLATLVVALGTIFASASAHALAVNGLVQDIASGAPAAVPDGTKVRAIPGDGAPFIETETAGGQYVLELTAGSYHFEVGLAGKGPAHVSSSGDPATASSLMDDAVPFDVQAEMVLNIDLDGSQLENLVMVEGTIADAAAGGLANVQVRFWPSGMDDPHPFEVPTDANGVYGIDVPAGSYEVEVQPENSAPLWIGRDDTGANIVAKDDAGAFLFPIDTGHNQTIDLTLAAADLQPLAEVTGTITRDDGSGLMATVRLWPANDPDPDPFHIDTDSTTGGYMLHVPPGSYEVEIQPHDAAPLFVGLDDQGGRIIVDDGQNAHPFFVDDTAVTDIGLVIPADKIDPLIPVHGLIDTTDGSAIANAEVRFWPSGIADAHPIHAATGSDGTYDIDLPAGPYEVEIEPPGAASLWIGQMDDGAKVAEPTRQDAFSFFIDAGVNDVLGLTLQSDQIVDLIPIGGAIQFSDESKVAGAEVRFYPFGIDDPEPIETVTDIDGLYSIELAPGGYGIEVQVPGKAPIFVGLDDATDTPVVETNPDNAFNFHVGDGSPWLTGINLTLVAADLDSLVTAFGNIREATVAVGGAEVILVPAGTAMLDPIVTITDGDGNYEVPVPPGGYTIEVHLPGKGPVFIGLEDVNGVDTPVAKHDPSKAFNFFLDAASPWTADTGPGIGLDIPADFVLPLENAFGTISRAGGPLAGAEVVFLPTGVTDPHPFMTPTDADGHYDLQLPAGGYEVSVNLPGNAPIHLNVMPAANAGDPDVVVAENNPDNAFNFFLGEGSPWNQDGSDGISVDIPDDLLQPLATAFGTILEAGSAVKGAEVAFLPRGVTDPMPVVGLTDDMGHYDLMLVPGGYEVSVHLPGKAPLFLGLQVTADGGEMVVVEHNPENAHDFFIDEGSPWTMAGGPGISVDIPAGESQPLAGVFGVIREAGTPIGGAEVAFFPSGDPDSMPIVGMTDKDGHYDIGIPPGGYDVAVALPGKAPIFIGMEDVDGVDILVVEHDRANAFSFFVDAGSPWTDVNGAGIGIDIPAGAAQALTPAFGLVTEAGLAAPGAEVAFIPGNRADADAIIGLTKHDGSFDLNLPPGGYDVAVVLSGMAPVFIGLKTDADGNEMPVAVSNPENAFSFFLGEDSPWNVAGGPGIVIDIPAGFAQPLESAFGNIREAGVAVKGAEVAFFPAGMVDADPIIALTDNDGNFDIDLAPGGYLLQVALPGKAPLAIDLIPATTTDGVDTLVVAQDPANAHTFHIGAGSPWTDPAGPGFSIDIPAGEARALLPVFGTISEAGIAAQGAEVAFTPSGDDDAGPIIDLTDQQGQYDINLPPGGYDVAVALPGKAPVFLGLDVNADGVETVVAEPNPEHAHSFFIGPDSRWITDTRGISVDIPAGAAEKLVPTFGTILKGGVAASGAEVVFLPQGVPDPMPIVGVTRADGTYDIGLAPGSYRASVELPGKAPIFIGLDDNDLPMVVHDPAKAFGFFINAGGPWNTGNGISLDIPTDMIRALVEVTGTITVDATAEPGADVRLWPVGITNAQAIDAVTDIDGKYDIQVPPGLYQVEVQVAGKAPVHVGIDSTGSATIVAHHAEDGHVFDIDGANWSTIDLDIPSAGLKGLVGLAGTIQRSDSTLAAGVEVRAWPQGVENPEPFITLSDHMGRYEIQVPPGLYKIEVEEPGFISRYPSETDPAVLTADANNAFIFDVQGSVLVVDIILDAAMAQTKVTITGLVTSDGTEPIQGAQVIADPEDDWLPRVEAVTGSTGAYKLAVPPGNYRIKLVVPGFTGLFPTDEMATALSGKRDMAFVFGIFNDITIDLSRSLAPTGDIVELVGISGVVSSDGTAAGTPVQGADVIAHSQTSPGMSFGAGTDADGNYHILVPPGDYMVELQVDGFVRATPSSASDPAPLTHDTDLGVPFTVTADMILNMIFDPATMESAVRAVGSVSDEYGPIAGAHVSIFPLDDLGIPKEPSFNDQTDTGGHFDIDVAAGDYKIMVEMPGFESAFVSPTGMTPLAEEARVFTIDATTIDNPIAIAIAGTTGLQQEKVTISGTVTDTTGAGIPGVVVGMQPEMDGAWEQGTTDANGNYSIGVIPGQYRVEVMTKYWDWQTETEVTVPNSEGLIPGFAHMKDDATGIWNLTRDWGMMNIFSFSAPSVVNLQMGAGVAITGTVTLNGTAVAGAEVNVHTLDFQSSGWAQSDADGAFSMSVGPGQTYVVEVWPKWCDDTSPTVQECLDSRVDFIGGNLIVDAADQRIVLNAKGEPVITTTADQTRVDGAVMAIWDPATVTQFTVNEPLELGVFIDKGKQLSGRLIDSAGTGIARAWVDSDFGGAPTGADGSFTLNLPTSADAANSKATFGLRIWPPWCDDQQPDHEECMANRVDFIGGVVTAAGTLSPDWDQAAPFKTDGSDWPTDGLTVTASAGVKITGSVTMDGVPVPGIWVDAWSFDTTTGNGAETDANGNFAIAVEPPAEGSSLLYEVHIWSPDHIPPKPVLAEVGASGVSGVYGAVHQEEDADAGPQKGDPIDANGDGQTDTEVFLTLSTGKTISGRVVDASGIGIPHTWVDVHKRDFSEFFGASTDQDGNYVVNVPPAKDYIAVVWGDGGNLRNTWYDQAGSERDATPIDVSLENREGINFRMTAGSSISGTLTSNTADAGKVVHIGLYAESTDNWNGREVTLEADGSTDFTISGLGEADDYRLDIHGNGLVNGFYGGAPGDAASAPVGWERATLLNSAAGNITGVNLDLSATTTTLTLTVTGLQENDKVDGNLWSESLDRGGWAEARADANGVATVVIDGLDSSGSDYKLFVGSPTGSYKIGNYMGTPVATTDTDFSDGDDTATEAGVLVDWMRATEIDMSGDQSVKVAMDAGATIAGTVSGLSASQRVRVEAWSESVRSWSEVEVTAGSDGTAAYTLKGLDRASDFRVMLKGDGIREGFYSGTETLAHWDNARLVNISTDNATGIDLTVSAGVSISGTVSGSGSGDGLQSGQSAWVFAWSDSTFSGGGAPVEGDGGAAVSYTIKGLASAADYEVRLFADGYVGQVKESVDATTDKTGVDFTLSTGGKISGSVSGLQAYQRAWVESMSDATGSWGGIGIVADANGAATYTIDGLAAGTDHVVALWVGPKGYFYNSAGVKASWSEHEAVTVTSGTTADIDFDLSSAGSLFVSLSGTVSGLTDGGNEWVEVMAWSDSGGGSWTSRIGNGTYTLEGLTAGQSYSVAVVVEGYAPTHTKEVTVTDNAVTSVTWSASHEGLTPFTVSADTTGLDVALSSGHSISGTVTLTDSSGTNAVSGVHVMAWDDANSIGKGGKTNSSGEFTIKGLPDGTYSVSVWTESGAKEISVTLSGADLTGQDLAIVKADGGISGTVTSSAGVAKAGVAIEIFDANDDVVANTATNATGEYTVEGLADGSYTVKAYNDENLTSSVTLSVTVSGAMASGSDLQLTVE